MSTLPRVAKGNPGLELANAFSVSFKLEVAKPIPIWLITFEAKL
jgi:hypothetical protein